MKNTTNHKDSGTTKTGDILPRHAENYLHMSPEQKLDHDPGTSFFYKALFFLVSLVIFFIFSSFIRQGIK